METIAATLQNRTVYSDSFFPPFPLPNGCRLIFLYFLPVSGC